MLSSKLKERMSKNPFVDPENKLLSQARSGLISLSLIGITIIWNAWQLRATSNSVAYLNDSSMHEQMVRFANTSLMSGQLPILRWFPYLNVGSPHFLHYQGLAATLTGALGIITGPDFAFRWTLYLLLVGWPISIYASARIFHFSRAAATAAAVMSPFMMSVPLVGYEQKAYIWLGFGIWAQLCASWTLPFAWALTWRAIEDRRYLFSAGLLITITTALHFETGYLAFAAIIIFPFLRSVDLKTRIRRAAVLLGGVIIGTSWITAPLLLNAKWAAVNSALINTGLVRGYGARQDLTWLFHGQTFDNGRLPVISIALALGVVTTLIHWKRNPENRPVFVLFLILLLISFGPTTWGVLINILPGHADIYFRRFLMGVQLGGIYLAGIGVAALSSVLVRVMSRWRTMHPSNRKLPPFKLRETAVLSLAVFLVIVLCIPAVLQLRKVDQQNAVDIGQQRISQGTYGPQIDSIISYIKDHPAGRTYAGLPTNWGTTFTVGYVPVFKYIEASDVDEIGYTLRTASLMSQPEYRFQEQNLSDYYLFGIHYLILPWLQKPPIPGVVPVMIRGQYELWKLPNSRYLSVLKPAGSIDENKSTIGVQSTYVLNTHLIQQFVDLNVNWAVPSDNVNWPTITLRRPAGTILISDVNLPNGSATATVSMREKANVTLSASFDPGWKVSVDGQPARSTMLAPAVVSVAVPPGIHTVNFIYEGFPWFYEFLAFSIGGLILLALFSRGAFRFLTLDPREEASSNPQNQPIDN